MKKQSLTTELIIQKTIISLLDLPEPSEQANEQQKSAYTTLVRTILTAHPEA